MIKQMNWLIRLLTPKWVCGITIAPFGIYLAESVLTDPLIITHELIHWRQQLEMLIIFFYLWYLIEWFVKLFRYGAQAYVNISFERQAYAMDETRFGWIKYL